MDLGQFMDHLSTILDNEKYEYVQHFSKRIPGFGSDILGHDY